MSVLIKGMKMPKNCDKCILSSSIAMRCDATKKSLVTDTYPKRPSWCPLVKIPEPHGRLIDADEYEKHLASIANTFARSDAQKSLMGRAIFCLENAPTIIESEGQGHE